MLLLSTIIEPAAHALSTGTPDALRRTELSTTLEQASTQLHQLLTRHADPTRGWIDGAATEAAATAYAALREAVGDASSVGRERRTEDLTELGQIFARAQRSLQSSPTFARWLTEFVAQSSGPLHQLDLLGKGVAIGGLVASALADLNLDSQRHFMTPTDRDSARFDRASGFTLTAADAVRNGDPLLLVDDMVATGGTVTQAVAMLRERFPASPIAVVTGATGWALFAEEDDGAPGSSSRGLSLFDLSTGDRLLLD